MHCPECQTDNPAGSKFCNECGTRLPACCPACGKSNPSGSKFCNECGHKLDKPADLTSSFIKEAKHPPSSEAERKTVTVLFSDMSGYTAMSEKLDPEDVKDITGRIFPKISQVVARYDGFIEKYVGDAVMAVFGVPHAHEDDPVRAIMAAREIHNVVEKLSPRWESKIGRPLAMHTGINTGLVVTGEVNAEKGTHGLSGDTINVAARLAGVAKDGEIISGPETFSQADSYFSFEKLTPATVKGKSEPVQIYKVLAPLSRPGLFRRIHGLRADLIGRQVELGRLLEAAQSLEKGRGAVFTVVGDAGVGKTRLLEEFKKSLGHDRFRWIEGQAYAFSQNSPYAPLTNLLAKLFQLEELDEPEKTLKKIESAITGLVVNPGQVVPYVANLFGISLPQDTSGSPEFWRTRFNSALLEFFSALAQDRPTVICLEDMHWSDPSTLDSLRHITANITQPALLILSHRPRFSPLTANIIAKLGDYYQEINITELSPSETQSMLESLLGSHELPRELRRFVQDKVGGNPFYLEEVINSLIESRVLERSKESWHLTQSLRHIDMPSTIQGIITARLDRLEREPKKILQEASVIGRAFLYDILKHITDLTSHLDHALGGLERLDLIQTRTVHPELEYVFKQAVIQEVVYQSILKKERQAVHERIAQIIEELFGDRLDEFCETLALHYSCAKAVDKAVHYLLLAGEKSLARYAVDESHNYYQQAYDLLSADEEGSEPNRRLLVDMICKWALVFYYRGDMKGLSSLLTAHEPLAVSLGDETLLGIFYSWRGYSLWAEERHPESYDYLVRALNLGEKLDDPQVVSYASSWLSWSCPELGRFDEGIAHGERAIALHSMMEHDPYPYFKALGGIGYCCWYMGDRERAENTAGQLLEFGRRQANIRCQVMGYYVQGLSLLIAGDFPAAEQAFRQASEVALDPLYSQFPAFMLGLSLIEQGQVEQAEHVLNGVLSFCQEFGFTQLGMPAVSFLALTAAKLGRLGQGLKGLEEVLAHYKTVGRRASEMIAEHMLGRFYLEVLKAKGQVGLGAIARNVGFIVKNASAADRRGIEHLNRAVELSRKHGTFGFLGPSYLALGEIHAHKGATQEAREWFLKAVEVFDKCRADVYLARARDAIAELDKSDLL